MKRILVLGMGRSGTKFVCDYLASSGVFLDTPNWANEHPLGRLINDTVFTKAFGARKGLPYGTLPDAEVAVDDETMALAAYFRRYMDLQAAACGAECWAFKDPRSTILRRMWEPDMHHIVAVFRDPGQVVASYCQRGWIDGPEAVAIGLGYWKRFNRSLIKTVQGRDPSTVSVVRFGAGVEDRMAALVARCNLSPGPKTGALRYDAGAEKPAEGIPIDDEARMMFQWLQDHEIKA